MGLPLDHQINQRGPRAHQFAAGVSILVGLSFIIERTKGYTFADAFSLFGDQGKYVWGWSLMVMGVLTLASIFMVMRVACLTLLTLIWFCLAGLVGYGTWLSPDASKTTSFATIMCFAMVSVCVLGCSNLRRDFLPWSERLRRLRGSGTRS